MPRSPQMLIEDNGNEVIIEELIRKLAVAGKRESLPYLQTVCVQPWGLWETKGSSHGEVHGGRAYGNLFSEDLSNRCSIKKNSVTAAWQDGYNKNMLIFMEFFSFTFDEIFMTFSQKGMRKKHLERKENHEFFRLVCNLLPQIFFILPQIFF